MRQCLPSFCRLSYQDLLGLRAVALVSHPRGGMVGAREPTDLGCFSVTAELNGPGQLPAALQGLSHPICVMGESFHRASEKSETEAGRMEMS